ncbi:MAG: BglG family transcription antiterminator [Leptotrichiaceae bacterium]|nr:BglG family transcription antiterminator [Leptotrichiaceae bacterium]MBP7100579.1 BglG family transcription antiterminator [Leptotrichiaceae bacterium]MBP7725257.1 BglG family transcription antiterminator [Leptotrichiaceae bacterium]MBP9629501.1 BglG family transcription antiterminator [Leptotrichiaceae bacterium]
MLNNKEIDILNKLSEGVKYSFKEISEKYDISDRTARYYINNIDYILDILGYKITEKNKNVITLDINQDFKKIFEILKENKRLFLDERQYMLKLILFFDKNGLNISEFSKENDFSRTTVKKDLKILENELKESDIELIYVNNKGYRLVGNKQKILVKQEEVIEKVLNIVENKSKITNVEILNKFYKYIKTENIEKIKKFILKIEKKMKLSINKESYNKIISYMLVLLNYNENDENDENLLAKKFIYSTEEFKIIKQVLFSIFGNNGINNENLLRISDLIMGMSINGLKNNSFEDWIDEELMIRKMIIKIGKVVKIDLSEDEILYEGLLYHIKPAMYRMKNNIQIVNSVFKELIITNDPVLKVVKEGLSEIEKLFNVEFPEDEISLIGFHIKAAIERNTEERAKKIILVCGLGYGSSKVLEQSLKENYDLDIVDVLSYSFIENSIPNYKNVDLILTTVDFNNNSNIPVIKINPLLKEDDMKELSKYGIKKNKNKISLKNMLNIIEKNAIIKNKEELIENLKREFGSKVINDFTEIYFSLNNFLNKENVKIIDRVNDWKEAVLKSGEILIKNKVVNKKYVDEMIKIILKLGAYIVIEEGIAIPHASISENVYKTGVSLLIVKEKIYFPNGKGANIFLSFAAKNKNEYEIILKDLFELITKYNFIEEISNIKNYTELEKYFERSKYAVGKFR